MAHTLLLIALGITLSTQLCFSIPRRGETPAGGRRSTDSAIEHLVSISLRSGSATFKYDGSDKKEQMTDFGGVSLEYRPVLRSERLVHFFPSFGLHSFNGQKENENSYYSYEQKIRLWQLGFGANAGLNIASLVPESKLPVEPNASAGLGWFITGRWQQYGGSGWEKPTVHLTQLALLIGAGALYPLPANPKIAIGLQLGYIKGLTDFGLNVREGGSDKTKLTVDSFQYGVILAFRPGSI